MQFSIPTTKVYAGTINILPSNNKVIRWFVVDQVSGFARSNALDLYSVRSVTEPAFSRPSDTLYVRGVNTTCDLQIVLVKPLKSRAYELAKIIRSFNDAGFNVELL